MYAVAFDLVVADTEKNHPKGVTQAYTEIGAVLGEHGFRAVSMSATMKTWRISFLPFNRYVPVRGSRSQCVTFVHSASNSGQTLLLL